MSWSVFFGNILIHVGVLALFLTVIFFTHAKEVEKEIVQEQIDFIINNIIGDTFNVLDESDKTILRDKINNYFNSIDFSVEDKLVQEKNSKILQKALIFIVILVGVLLLIIVGMGVYFKWDSKYIKFLLISGVIGLIFVALTELSFLHIIAKNYLSADPKRIKRKVIEALYNNRCNDGDNDCIDINYLKNLNI